MSAPTHREPYTNSTRGPIRGEPLVAKMTDVVLGFTAPPLRDQVRAPARLVRRWQRTSDAIHLLYLDGYITQAQKHRMCQRLFAEMRRHFTRAGGAK